MEAEKPWDLTVKPSPNTRPLLWDSQAQGSQVPSLKVLCPASKMANQPTGLGEVH